MMCKAVNNNNACHIPPADMVRNKKCGWKHNQYNSHSLSVEIGHQNGHCSAKSNGFSKSTLTACRDWTPKQISLIRKIKQIWWHKNQNSLAVKIRHRTRCCSAKSNRIGSIKPTLTCCRDWQQSRCCSEKSNIFGGIKSTLTAYRDWTQEQMWLRKIKRFGGKDQHSQTVEIGHQNQMWLSKIKQIWWHKMNTHCL